MVSSGQDYSDIGNSHIWDRNMVISTEVEDQCSFNSWDWRCQQKTLNIEQALDSQSTSHGYNGIL